MCSQNFNSLSEPAETSSSFIMFGIRNSASEAFPQHSPLRILRTLAMKQLANLSARQSSVGALAMSRHSFVIYLVREPPWNAEFCLSGEVFHEITSWITVSEERVKFSLQLAACTLRASRVVQLHLSVRLQRWKCRCWQGSHSFFKGLIK